MTNPPKSGIDPKRLQRYSAPVTIREAAKLTGYWLLSLIAFILIIVTFPIWIIPVAFGIHALAKMHAWEE